LPESLDRCVCASRQ